MAVVLDAVVRIERHVDVWEMRLLDNAPPQLALLRLFRLELRHDDQRNGAARSRQPHRRAKDFARDRHFAFDRVLAPIAEESSQQRRQTPVVFRRKPDQTRAEVRPVIIKVAIEDRRREEQHDGDGMLETR